jgi:predicted N-acetyltransferase YhbS
LLQIAAINESETSSCVGPEAQQMTDCEAIDWEGPRRAEEHELVQVVELADMVLMQNNPGHGHAWAHVYRTGNLGNICVAKHRGRVVHASAMYFHTVATPTGQVRVAGLSGVCTHPDYRRHGIGSRAMLYCLDYMRAQGAHLGLLSTPVPDWYRKFGWENAGAEDTYCFDRGNIALLPHWTRFQIREAVPADQSKVLHLLNRQPGGGRAADIDRILLDIKQPLTMVADQGGQILGFARTARRRVIEYAGEAEVVAALVRAVFERLDDPHLSTTDRDSRNAPVLDASLRLVSPAYETQLSHCLDELGIPYSRKYLGMIRIIDPAGLMEEFGLKGAAVTVEGESTTVSYQGEKATFDARSLAKLLCGPERLSPFCAELLPVLFYVWPWDRV